MNRAVEFDILKGLAVICVIVAHIVTGSMLAKFISLFHMPLFFLVSGYFWTQKDNRKYIQDNVKNLLVNYFKYGLITVVLYFLLFNIDYAVSYAKIISLGSCINNEQNLVIGPLWFLLVMFWCRIFYNLTAKYFVSPNIFLLVLFLAFTALMLFKGRVDYNKVPFFVAHSIPALFFFHCGHMLKTFNKPITPRAIFILLLVCSLFTIFQMNTPGTLGFSSMKFTLYPICIINAVIITILLLHFCKRIASKQYNRNMMGGGVQFVSFCGAKSMDIYMFHCIEFCIFFPFVSQYINNYSGVLKILLLALDIVLMIGLCVAFALIKTKFNNRIGKIYK